jgi:hypothetical protein
MTSKVVSINEDNIKVSYVRSDGVLVQDASVFEANEYEKLNPETTYLFLDGNNKYRYLNINEVNQLTTTDLVSTKSVCDTAPRPVTSPEVVFSGGDGIGAEANPIISPGGALLGIDIVNPGIGYQTAPTITISDPSNTGSGAVVQATIENGSVTGGIVLDSGSNYVPSQFSTQQVLLESSIPRYPTLLSLKEIVVNNPGINYSPGVDVVEITPNNGAILQATFTPFGQVVGVKVVRPGIGFTSRPTITIRSESGINADFTPVFEIIRDPVLFSPQLQQRKIITVIDTVGLKVQGYVSGKAYYGNVYFDGGVKYAGPYKTFETPIRVYDTLAESIK